MLKPLAEVHAGRLSVPLHALTFSVTDVLKDLDPLVDENISNSKHESSKWAEQSLAYRMGFQPQYLTESCLHPNAAQYSIVRVFASCKSNIKANNNVTAHLNHIKNTRNMHSLRHRHVVG